MEINLNRIDYAQVGTLSRKCMRLLPPPQQNMTQRVAVGAHNGIVFCFGRKKTDTIISFKTLPGPKVDGLVLGGALGTPQDKIFVATGNTVKGFSKKGKQFFGFETNLTESIQSMYIYGVDMFLCTQYTFNHYHDCKDANFVLCGDKVNDVICLPIVEGSWVGRGITPVLACEDRTIKVISGSEVACQVEVSGSPLTLLLYQNTGGSSGTEVLYGTRDGKLGLVDLPVNGPAIKWEVQTPSGFSGITALDCYSMTSQGTVDIVVGRDDGNVEIYVLDEDDQPLLKQSVQCNESIMALQCGRVGSPYYDEICVATYAEPAQKELHQGQTAALPAHRSTNPEIEAKIQQMKQELEQLQDEVAQERENYQQSTHSENGYSAVPVFAINDRFTLSQEEAAYILSIELQVAIDYVLLQCDVPVDLLDVERNSAVVSLTPCTPNSGNSLLATYRCQANTMRLEMKIRSIEGQYGTLQAYISPRIHPKTCQVRQYSIKPLSLHQRTHTYDHQRPENILRLSGSFSIAEAHSWVVLCLPEIPEKPPVTESATIYFISTFTNTQLSCVYTKGEAVFKSDNISTIAILKDVLSKEATRKKIRIDINSEINEKTVAHTLQLMHPKLEYQLSLAKKVHLIDALRELTIHETDTSSFLAQDLVDVLKNADQLQAEYKSQHAHLERIYGIITDMYIDKYKFKGQNAKHKVPQLLQVLDNYSVEALIQFFQTG